MDKNGLDLISELWTELFDESFDVSKISEIIYSQFGHERTLLTQQDIADALTKESFQDWKTIGWVSKEQLVHYTFPNVNSKSDFFAGVSLSCLYYESVRRGLYGWSFIGDFIIEMLYINLDKSNHYFRLQLLSHLFAQVKDNEI